MSTLFIGVTEYWLSQTFYSKPGITMGSDNHYYLDCGQIVERYWIDPLSGNQKRLPQQSELSRVPPLTINSVTEYPSGTLNVFFKINYQPQDFEYLGVCWADYPSVPTSAGNHFDDHIADITYYFGVYEISFAKTSGSKYVRAYGQFRNIWGELIDYYSDLFYYANT